ncbi:hypothetical protein GH714_009105 [Hevea brasiliensis]|uniref:SHSP domain-containing protein n=1 Tax=Hevea brasiliensis TaxID=3981 RepID=A0A6A6MLM0_HEVBR|nr:hypothetical protein GH714_009105 [Hevea brasiliensis]
MASAVPLTKPFSYRTKRISTHDPDMGPQLPIPIPVATGNHFSSIDIFVKYWCRFEIFGSVYFLFWRREGRSEAVDGHGVSAHQGRREQGAEDEYDFKEEKKPKKYFYECQMAPELYQTDKIKALMKNGVLKIVVPKVNTQEEEKEGVTRIKVN